MFWSEEWFSSLFIQDDLGLEGNYSTVDEDTRKYPNERLSVEGNYSTVDADMPKSSTNSPADTYSTLSGNLSLLSSSWCELSTYPLVPALCVDFFLMKNGKAHVLIQTPTNTVIQHTIWNSTMLFSIHHISQRCNTLSALNLWSFRWKFLHRNSERYVWNRPLRYVKKKFNRAISLSSKSSGRKFSVSFQYKSLRHDWHTGDDKK
jgi:hypothetical protein